MNAAGKRMLREMREIVRINENSSEAPIPPFRSGVTFFVNEEFEQAIDAFRQAIDLSPDFAFSHYYLGRCLRRVGNYDEAIESLSRSLELNPLHSPSHAYLGDIFLRQGKLVEAERAFREAIDLQFDNVTALSGLVRLNKNKDGDHDELAELLKDAYIRGANNPILLMELFSFRKPRSEFCMQVGDGLVAQRSYTRALFFYRLALREDPKNEVVHRKIYETAGYLNTQ